MTISTSLTPEPNRPIDDGDPLDLKTEAVSTKPSLQNCFDIEKALRIIQIGQIAIEDGSIPQSLLPPTELQGKSRLLTGKDSTGRLAFIDAENHGDPQSLEILRTIVNKLGEYRPEEILFILENAKSFDVPNPPFHFAIVSALAIAAEQGIKVTDSIRNSSDWGVMNTAVSSVSHRMASTEALATYIFALAQGMRTPVDVLSGVESVRTLLEGEADNATADIYGGIIALGKKAREELQQTQIIARQSYQKVCGQSRMTSPDLPAYLAEATKNGLTRADALGGLAVIMAPRGKVCANVAECLITTRQNWGENSPSLLDLHRELIAARDLVDSSPRLIYEKCDFILNSVSHAADAATTAEVRTLVSQNPGIKVLVFVTGMNHARSVIQGLAV